MRAHEFVIEKKKRKRRSRGAAYGPGPYGGYGYYAGYSGDSGEGGDGGGGESVEHENFANSAEAYRAHLIKTLPQIIKLFANIGKGWIPSKDEMLSAVDNAYQVMKHTGDAKQAGKALMDELNTLHRMSQGKKGIDENFADGKKPGRKGLAKRSGVNTKASVSSLRKTAKSSSGEKARMAHWLANMKAGRAKKNKQYTMKIREILESATAGATSAGNVAVGAVYKNKPGKTPKNRDGTAKNALDLKGVGLLTGGSLIKR